jgi:hypothetical protein
MAGGWPENPLTQQSNIFSVLPDQRAALTLTDHSICAAICQI